MQLRFGSLLIMSLWCSVCKTTSLFA